MNFRKDDDFMNERKQKGVRSIGEKIRDCREGAQLTQSELAERLSVTRQAVSNWERDKTLPDIYVLQEIAEVFEETLDEFMEGAKKPEVIMPKTPFYLLLGTFGACLAQVAAFAGMGNLKGEVVAGVIVIDVVIGVFIQLFLHLYFSNAVKSSNFSMIAGYDNKVEYCVEEVKKVLIQIDCHVGCISFGTIFLMGACLFLDESVRENVAISLVCIYCLDLVLAILLTNYRSLGKTLVKEQEQKIAKAGYISVFWFVAWIFLFILLTILRFELGHVQNNSLQALGYMGWMCLFLAIVLTGLFYEQWRVKREMEENGRYRPGKCFLVCNILSVIVTVGMFFC